MREAPNSEVEDRNLHISLGQLQGLTLGKLRIPDHLSGDNFHLTGRLEAPFQTLLKLHVHFKEILVDRLSTVGEGQNADLALLHDNSISLRKMWVLV